MPPPFIHTGSMLRADWVILVCAPPKKFGSKPGRTACASWSACWRFLCFGAILSRTPAQVGLRTLLSLSPSLSNMPAFPSLCRILPASHNISQIFFSRFAFLQLNAVRAFAMGIPSSHCRILNVRVPVRGGALGIFWPHSVVGVVGRTHTHSKEVRMPMPCSNSGGLQFSVLHCCSRVVCTVDGCATPGGLPPVMGLGHAFAFNLCRVHYWQVSFLSTILPQGGSLVGGRKSMFPYCSSSFGFCFLSQLHFHFSVLGFFFWAFFPMSFLCIVPAHLVEFYLPLLFIVAIPESWAPLSAGALRGPWVGVMAWFSLSASPIFRVFSPVHPPMGCSVVPYLVRQRTQHMLSAQLCVWGLQ